MKRYILIPSVAAYGAGIGSYSRFSRCILSANINFAIGCSAKAVPGAMFLAPEILQVDTLALRITKTHYNYLRGQNMIFLRDNNKATLFIYVNQNIICPTSTLFCGMLLDLVWTPSTLFTVL